MAHFRNAYTSLRNMLTRQICSSTMTDGEKHIFDVIKRTFPQASSVKVQDISGGCGAMYDVHIESPQFKNKKLVQQHMMVNKALKTEIAEMHGIRINTSVPEEPS